MVSTACMPPGCGLWHGNSPTHSCKFHFAQKASASARDQSTAYGRNSALLLFGSLYGFARSKNQGGTGQRVKNVKKPRQFGRSLSTGECKLIRMSAEGILISYTGWVAR